MWITAEYSAGFNKKVVVLLVRHVSLRQPFPPNTKYAILRQCTITLFFFYYYHKYDVILWIRILRNEGKRINAIMGQYKIGSMCCGRTKSGRGFKEAELHWRHYKQSTRQAKWAVFWTSVIVELVVTVLIVAMAWFHKPKITWAYLPICTVMSKYFQLQSFKNQR